MPRQRWSAGPVARGLCMPPQAKMYVPTDGFGGMSPEHVVSNVVKKVCIHASVKVVTKLEEVQKIEPPQGDGYRLLHGRHRHDFNWSLTSRHKEGMVIDLNQTEGQALLHELVAKADVFVSNFREDQSQRYAADAATLRALNPRLIYAQFTGFGSVGPDREKRGYDTTAWWASSGILDLMKPREGLPVFPVGGVGDHASAMALFGAIVTALYQREKNGFG